MTTSVATGAILAALTLPAAAQDGGNMKATANASGNNDCQVVNQQIEQQMAANPEMRSEYSGQVMRDLRQLRDAAQTLQSYGKTEACQSLAEAMHEITQNPEQPQTGQQQASADNRQATGNQQSMSGSTTSGNTVDQSAASAPQPENQQAGTSGRDGQQGFANAQAVSDMQGRLRAETILGSDVRGRDENSIGEVDELVLGNDGRPTYAVVTYGGFLGLGEEASAVPFKMLRVSQNNDVYYLPMTESELENAPRFEQGSFDWTEDEQWRSKNDQYFSSVKNNTSGEAG
ncbi:hypothetical protein HNS03_13840 [Amorphus sp. 3PC139-8]